MFCALAQASLQSLCRQRYRGGITALRGRAWDTRKPGTHHPWLRSAPSTDARIVDSIYLQCRNCWLRDEDCETTDPRHPEAGPVVVRRWATKDGLLPGQNPAATHRNQASVPKHTSALPQQQQQQQQQNVATMSAGHEPMSTSPHDWGSTTNFGPRTTPSNGDYSTEIDVSDNINTPQHSELGTQSWVSKAYRQAAAQGQDESGNHTAGGIQHPDIVINTDDSPDKVKVSRWAYVVLPLV